MLISVIIYTALFIRLFNVSETRNKIITAATECFFQHGFSATTISMVSRYSKVSRVTIHKQISSKEDLFRQVVTHFFEERRHLLNHYQEQTGPFWQDTHQLIQDRSQSVFEDITNANIRSDLVHAANMYCSDIIDHQCQLICQALQYRLRQALTKNEISLERLSLTTDEFAKSIEAATDGIFLSQLNDCPMTALKHMLQVYQAATTA